jgi:hypothetical protein
MKFAEFILRYNYLIISLSRLSKFCENFAAGVSLSNPAGVPDVTFIVRRSHDCDGDRTNDARGSVTRSTSPALLQEIRE